MVDPVIATGLSGLQKSIRGADQAAQQIASGSLPSSGAASGNGAITSNGATTGNGGNTGNTVQSAGQTRASSPASSSQDGGNSLLKPIIDLKLYSISAQANAKVVKTGEQMVGTLLNTNA